MGRVELRLIIPKRVICSKAEPLLFLRVRLKQKLTRRNSTETLQEMFEETLKDVYFAENAIIKALPKMAKPKS